MTEELKNFIENNIELIESNNFAQLYMVAKNYFFNRFVSIGLSGPYIGELTEVLLNVDIHPEDYLEIIPKYYLYGSSTINTFHIPNNINKISSSAFERCDKLESITLSNSLINIGEEAFLGCSQLTRIDFPESLTYIGEGAFKFCRNLNEIHLNNQSIYIGEKAFYGCSKDLAVIYGGTKSQWNKFMYINFPENILIKCLDGELINMRY